MLSQLLQIDLEETGQGLFLWDNENVQEALIDFLRSKAEKLKALGWEIEIDSALPVHHLFESGEFYVDVEDSKDVNNWFDVELGALIGGQRVNLLPFLKKLLCNKNLAGFMEQHLLKQ